MATTHEDKNFSGKGRILFVDDEQAVAEIMNQMLEALGYDVTCHVNCASALEDFNKEPDGYGLIIADHVMPGMTGLELAGQVKTQRPDTPVILCTGYAPEDLSQEAEKCSVAAVMEKPFCIQTLARTIAKAINTTHETHPAV